MTPKENPELQTRPGFEGIDVSTDAEAATSGPRIARANRPSEDFQMSAPAKPAPSGVRRNVPVSPAESTPPRATALPTAATIDRPAKPSPVGGFRRLAADVLRRMFGELEPLDDDLPTAILRKLRPEGQAILSAWAAHETAARELARFLPAGTKSDRQRIVAELHASPERAGELAGELAAIDAVERDVPFQTTVRVKIAQSLSETVIPAVAEFRIRLEAIRDEMVERASSIDLVTSNLNGRASSIATARVTALLDHWVSVLRDSEDPTMGGRLPVGSAQHPTFALDLARRAVNG